MKKIAISFPLACLLLFNGCATNNAFMDNIGKIGGTTAGAGVGAVVGKQLGGRGGLIAGALIGGTIGYLIGDEIDKRRAELAKIAKEEKIEVYSEDITSENLAVTTEVKEDASTKKANVIGDSFTVISDDNQFNIGSSSLNPKSTLVFNKFAEQYKNKSGSLESNVNSLIRWQMSKTATSGFLTGLGGLITLPVAVPADIASGIFVHMRMIAAIAHIGGYDVKDDKVKSLIYMCLVGESLKDMVKATGITIGNKLATGVIKKIPGTVLTKINQKVSFRLVTKFGEKGAINLVKVIPFAGGIVGASVNAVSTNTIGNFARKTFIADKSFTNDFIYQFSDENQVSNAIVEEQIVVEEFIKEKNITTEDVPNTEIFKLYAYLNLIKIDGVIKESEQEIFEELINNSLLDDIIKYDLIQKLNTKEPTPIDFSIFSNNPEESISLLSNLVLIAKCDNELHITEKMYIKNVGKQLGFSIDEIDEIIKL